MENAGSTGIDGIDIDLIFQITSLHRRVSEVLLLQELLGLFVLLFLGRPALAGILEVRLRPRWSVYESTYPNISKVKNQGKWLYHTN